MGGGQGGTGGCQDHSGQPAVGPVVIQQSQGRRAAAQQIRQVVQVDCG